MRWVTTVSLTLSAKVAATGTQNGRAYYCVTKGSKGLGDGSYWRQTVVFSLRTSIFISVRGNRHANTYTTATPSSSPLAPALSRSLSWTATTQRSVFQTNEMRYKQYCYRHCRHNEWAVFAVSMMAPTVDPLIKLVDLPLNLLIDILLSRCSRHQLWKPS